MSHHLEDLPPAQGEEIAGALVDQHRNPLSMKGFTETSLLLMRDGLVCIPA